MKERKLIIDEAKKRLQASAGKNKYRVIDAVREMPVSEGFVPPLLRLRIGRNEIPRERRGYVHIPRRAGGVLQRDDSQSCASRFGGRTNQGIIN